MVPEMLQDELVEEMKVIFADDLFKSPMGERIPINVFAQSLPIEESDDDEDPAPYIIVRIVKGDDEGSADSNHVVKMLFIIGIYDDDTKAQGHRTVLHIINKIYDRFKTDPNLNNKYVCDGPFVWEIQDDAYYPYYFGAVHTSFNIPAIRREDKFA